MTRDVFAKDRTADGFGWLISIADLTESAEFSHFPNCDRIFTLIEGGGLTLTLAGSDPISCQLLVPVCFPGDIATSCTMPPGPGRAFNVFVDRRFFNALVSIQTISSSHAIRTGPGTMAVFCASGSLEIGAATLSHGDTLVGSGTSIVHAVGAASIALIVEIHRNDS